MALVSVGVLFVILGLYRVAKIRRYFAQRSASELLPKNEETLQMEIRNSINDDVLTNSKIRDVKFKSLEVIEQ